MSGDGYTAVIPLFNKAPTIARALRSVLDQTVPPERVIVVDDGSTDGSAAAAEAVKDGRIEIERQDNRGASAARNRGMALAPTDRVALLDADDAWKPRFGAAMLALHKAFPEAGLWGCGFELVDAAGAAPRAYGCRGVRPGARPGLLKDFFRCARWGPPICCSGVMLSRTVLDEVGGFPEGIRLGEDFDLWLRIALRYPVAFDPAPLVVYHKEAAARAMQRERWAGRDTCIYRTLKQALAAPPSALAPRRSLRLLLGAHLLDSAGQALDGGDTATAADLVRETAGMGVWLRRCWRFGLKLARRRSRHGA